MGSHPSNLALRFGLELAAMAVWGTFRVQNNPGKAPIEVPGIVRLVIQ